MILSRAEIEVLRPTFALLQHFEHADVTVTFNLMPGGRSVTVNVCASGVTIKATFPDSAPVVEHYKSPMGLAQSYGLPLAKITNRAEGS